MKRPCVRVALAVLICLSSLSPAAWGRDWRRSTVRFGHPNELIMMASIRIGDVRIALVKQPFLGFTLLATQITQPRQTVPSSSVTSGRISTRSAR